MGLYVYNRSKIVNIIIKKNKYWIIPYFYLKKIDKTNISTAIFYQEFLRINLLFIIAKYLDNLIIF